MTSCRPAIRALAIAFGLGIFSANASAQEPIRMATAWSGGPHLELFAKGFASKVEKLTGGKVRFQVFAGGTIGSPLKITETVQKKIAPAGHTWSGYDLGVDKTSVLFGGYPGTPGAEGLLHWLYNGGGAELWEQWRMEKFGIVGMPCGGHSDEIHMHSKKPVRKIEDIKGLKWRTSGAAAEIGASLGASTVILAGGDVYPALERGLVDAIEWSTPGVNLPFGFQKISKYIVLPGVQTPASVQECVFSKALWDGFDAQTQMLIRQAAKLSTLESWMEINRMDMDALETYRKEGITIMRVDDSYLEAWKKATRAWEDKYAADPKEVWFKKVLDHKRAFEARWENSKNYRRDLR